MCPSVCQLDDLRRWVLHLLEIDKVFGSVFRAQGSPLLSGVNRDGSQSHGHGQLNALNTDSATTAREDGPLSRPQLGLLDGRIGRRGGAHDGAGDVVGHLVRNQRRVPLG